MTNQHELKETLSVDVITPEHADRVTTPLFTSSKKKMFLHPLTTLPIKRDRIGRCWICNATPEETGQPLEAHHFGVERSFAEGEIDWGIVKGDYPDFDWASFDSTKPYQFVDDMEAQGILLCKLHHTGKGTGIHDLPFPLWVLQRYLKEGVQFTPQEIIHTHL